ncbi:putative phage tail protein [uncultured Martelella sp.]|uniref:putative phage tail protein n=1 Tax=uncultured Martelella sp. TaxID=392331 RepID=UPI0029C69681|nr:putative phage tail protein [uncultured Martelella sp.]
MRRLADIVRSIRAHWPLGFARPAEGGVMDAIHETVAGEVLTAEQAAATMMDEIDPRTADHCLADFERVLGPDPAKRDLALSGIDDRRKLAHQRWTAKGGQSIPYFLRIGEMLGLDIAITEFWPSRAGVLRAGTPLIADGEQFTWLISMPAVEVVPFRVGRNRAGHSLAAFQVNGSAEAYFQLIKPAHTRLIFQYSGA